MVRRAKAQALATLNISSEHERQEVVARLEIGGEVLKEAILLHGTQNMSLAVKALRDCPIKTIEKAALLARTRAELGLAMSAASSQLKCSGSKLTESSRIAESCTGADENRSDNLVPSVVKDAMRCPSVSPLSSSSKKQSDAEVPPKSSSLIPQKSDNALSSALTETMSNASNDAQVSNEASSNGAPIAASSPIQRRSTSPRITESRRIEVVLSETQGPVLPSIEPEACLSSNVLTQGPSCLGANASLNLPESDDSYLHLDVSRPLHNASRTLTLQTPSLFDMLENTVAPRQTSLLRGSMMPFLMTTRNSPSTPSVSLSVSVLSPSVGDDVENPDESEEVLSPKSTRTSRRQSLRRSPRLNVSESSRVVDAETEVDEELEVDEEIEMKVDSVEAMDRRTPRRRSTRNSPSTPSVSLSVSVPSPSVGDDVEGSGQSEIINSFASETSTPSTRGHVLSSEVKSPNVQYPVRSKRKRVVFLNADSDSFRSHRQSRNPASSSSVDAQNLKNDSIEDFHILGSVVDKTSKKLSGLKKVSCQSVVSLKVSRSSKFSPVTTTTSKTSEISRARTRRAVVDSKSEKPAGDIAADSQPKSRRSKRKATSEESTSKKVKTGSNSAKATMEDSIRKTTMAQESRDKSQVFTSSTKSRTNSSSQSVVVTSEKNTKSLKGLAKWESPSELKLSKASRSKKTPEAKTAKNKVAKAKKSKSSAPGASSSSVPNTRSLRPRNQGRV